MTPVPGSEAPGWSTPHPPSLRSGTFSHRGEGPAGEKGAPLRCGRQSPRSEINRSAAIAPLLLPLVGEGGRAEAKRRRGRMRGAGRSAALQAGTPPIRLGSQHQDEENENSLSTPFPPASIIGPSPSREPGAHRVSGRAAVPGRSRGGNAAGNFHPRPGPVSRLPRTGKGHRGGPDDRARPPAGRWEGAIHLLYEVPTQRPASRLLPRGSVL